MKNILILGCSLLLFLPLQAQQKKLAKKYILAARNASNQALKAQDLDQIASFWIEDVVILSANGTLLAKKQAIKDFLKKVYEQMSDVYYVRTPKKIKLHDNGQLAWEEGTWKSQRPNTPDAQEVGGKYSAIWVKVNGEWKMRSQYFGALY